MIGGVVGFPPSVWVLVLLVASLRLAPVSIIDNISFMGNRDGRTVTWRPRCCLHCT
jgi:hypothetical protein